MVHAGRLAQVPEDEVAVPAGRDEGVAVFEQADRGDSVAVSAGGHVAGGVFFDERLGLDVEHAHLREARVRFRRRSRT